MTEIFEWITSSWSSLPPIARVGLIAPFGAVFAWYVMWVVEMDVNRKPGRFLGFAGLPLVCLFGRRTRIARGLMHNFRANEIAFERAARDYYLARTGLTDWSAITPPLRAYWRHELFRAANELDAEITRLVEEADSASS